jgi:hypothetical protein
LYIIPIIYLRWYLSWFDLMMSNFLILLNNCPPFKCFIPIIRHRITDRWSLSFILDVLDIGIDPMFIELMIQPNKNSKRHQTSTYRASSSIYTVDSTSSADFSSCIYTVTRGSFLNRIKKITCFKLYWRKVYQCSRPFSLSFSYFLLPLLYPFSLFRQKTPVYSPQI